MATKYFYDPHTRRREAAIELCVKSGEVDYWDALQYLLAAAEGRKLTDREEAVRKKIRACLDKWAPPTLN